MLVYLLKSGACLAILLLFYKVVLERVSMHHFKRFYLLAALVLSLGIPTIVFTEYVEIVPNTISEQVQKTNPVVEATILQPVTKESPVNWEMVLWFIYGLGVLGFGFRFVKHLAQIWFRIRKNPKLKNNFIIRVLLAQQLPPHTFFSYIFLNKKQFEAQNIPPEVLLHEETHAKQKHSIDILLIELTQVFLWFNPLIYVLKSSIKLNHEFLADSAVVNKNNNHYQYQNTILSYLSNDNFQKHQSTGIANAINYSSIKKRFTVMKTNTSKKSIVLRSILLLPVLALILFGFSQREIQPKNSSTIINDIQIEIKKDGGLIINGHKTTVDKISQEATEINAELNPYFIKNYVHATILYDESQYKLIDPLHVELQSIGISNIKHISERTARVLNQNAFEPSPYGGKTLKDARKIRRENVFKDLGTSDIGSSTMEIIWLEIKNNDEIWFQNQKVSLNNLTHKIGETFEIDSSKIPYEVQIYSDGVITSKFINEIQTEIRKSGLKRITVFSDEYVIPENEFKEKVEITPESTFIETNKITFSNNLENQTTIKEILININNKGQLLVQDDLVAINELKEYLSKINKHLSFDERKKVVRSVVKVQATTPKNIIEKVDEILTEYGTATINIVGPENSINSSKQKSATREEMKAYNVLAKKYNEMDRNQMQIKMQDVRRLKSIYAKMSTKQREDAEPFPDFPEPPPLPAAPKAPEAPNEREVAAVKIKEIIEEQDPYDVVSGNMRTKQPIMAEPPLPPTYIKDIRLDNPPKPPTPPNPLDHVIKMAKKGAIFMYKGKEISSDKAIDLIKNNKELSISTKQTNNGTPVVKISKYL